MKNLTDSVHNVYLCTYRMFNNVQLFLVFHEIIIHIHNVHNAIATSAAETWGKY